VLNYIYRYSGVPVIVKIKLMREILKKKSMQSDHVFYI